MSNLPYSFDGWLKHLQASGKEPGDIVEAASYVKDTLVLAKALAHEAFNSPDSADIVAVYHLVNEEHRRRKAKG